MTFDLIAFAIVSALSFLSVLFMIRAKKLMHSAVYLALFFIFTSGIFALLGAVFLAVLQILIFAGGIVVLIIMVVMLSENGSENVVIGELKSFKFLASLVLFVLVMMTVSASDYGSVKAFGVNELSNLVIGDYSMAVLVSAFMLFAALVASVFFLKGENE